MNKIVEDLVGLEVILNKKSFRIIHRFGLVFISTVSGRVLIFLPQADGS